MSLKRSAMPLQLDLFGSRYLLYALVIFHSLAVGVLFLIELPLGVLFVLALILIVSAMNSIQIHAVRKSRRAVIRLIWEENGQWYIVRRSGEKTRVKFQGDSFSTPWLTVLNFKVPDKWFSQAVILARDNVNGDSHRRLRVRLKTDMKELLN